MSSKARQAVTLLMALTAFGVTYITIDYVDRTQKRVNSLLLEIEQKKKNLNVLNAAYRELEVSLNNTNIERNNGVSAFVALKNTLYEDENFIRLVNVYFLKNCESKNTFNCNVFTNFRALILANHIALLGRLNAKTAFEFKLLISKYNSILSENDKLNKNFSSENINKLHPSLQSADKPDSTDLNSDLFMMENHIQSPSKDKVESIENFIWSDDLYQRYQALAYEGLAYASWKLNNLASAREYIEQSLKFRSLDPQPAITNIKLMCALNEDKSKITAQYKSLIETMRKRLSLNPNNADELLRIEYLKNDYELYRGCNIDKI